MGIFILKIVLYRQIIHIYLKYKKVFKIQSKGRKAGYGILNKQDTMGYNENLKKNIY